MKRCKSCQYRRELFGFPGFPACHFAIDEGRLRECDPDGCVHYHPKKKRREKGAADWLAAEFLKEQGDLH